LPDPVIQTQTLRKQGRPHPRTTVDPLCRRGEAPPPERPQLDGFTDIQIAHLTRQTPIPPPVQSLTSNKGMQCTRIQFATRQTTAAITTTPKQRQQPRTQNPRSHNSNAVASHPQHSSNRSRGLARASYKHTSPRCPRRAMPCHATLLFLSPLHSPSPPPPTTPNINQVGE